MDKISVIIPVYNVAQYLNRCVESVLQQTYLNLEIWLIDDGSTDESSALCDTWKEQDERIKVIHQENKGLSGARNTALNKCTGDWISFVDSDDEIESDYLEQLLMLVKENHVMLAQCGCMEIPTRIQPEIKQQVMESREFMLSSYYQTMAWGKLYHKTCFKEQRFPQGKIHEDNAIIYQIVYQAKRVAFTTQALYLCNIREDSINTRATYHLDHLDRLTFLKEKIEYFHEMQEKELEQKAIREYQYDLLEAYSKVKKYYPKRRDILQEMKKSYRKWWKKMMQDEKIKYKTKLLLTVALFDPDIWKKVMGE